MTCSTLDKSGENPMAVLHGVTQRGDKSSTCAMVFHLATATGVGLDLTLAQLLSILTTLEEEEVIPCLPRDWRDQMEIFYGYAL